MAAQVRFTFEGQSRAQRQASVAKTGRSGRMWSGCAGLDARPDTSQNCARSTRGNRLVIAVDLPILECHPLTGHGIFMQRG